MSWCEESKGPVLCAKHARQVARDDLQADGNCSPTATWRGGDGSLVICDVVHNPTKVSQYEEETEARRRNRGVPQ